MAIRSQIKSQHGELPPLQKFELLEKIYQLSNIRDQALVSFLFLTGCRIEEVVRYREERAYKREQGIGVLDADPIRKKQVEAKAGLIIVHNIRTLKRKKTIRRSVPIVWTEEEKPFIDFFIDYLMTLQYEDFIFPISRQRAYQILSGVGLFPHYLRHLRSTRLVTTYDFSAEHLRQFHGWATSRTADEYVHLNVTDLIAKLRK